MQHNRFQHPPGSWKVSLASPGADGEERLLVLLISLLPLSPGFWQPGQIPPEMILDPDIADIGIEDIISAVKDDEGALSSNISKRVGCPEPQLKINLIRKACPQSLNGRKTSFSNATDAILGCPAPQEMQW